MLLADSAAVQRRRTPCQILKTYVLPVTDDTYEMAIELARWKHSTVDELVAEMIEDLYAAVFSARHKKQGRPHVEYCDLGLASN